MSGVPTVTLSGSAVSGHCASDEHRRCLMSASLPVAVKLGRKPPNKSKPVPRLAKYFDTAIMVTEPPAVVDYYTKAAASMARMYKNDQLGCCVISGKYHGEGVVSANDMGQTIVGTDDEVVRMYHGICGPGDNGCVITDVLDYQRDRGLPFSGTVRKIDGYVAGDHTNKLQVKVGTYAFGCPTIGINLPGAWTNSDTWDVTNSGIVGGHDVTVVGYDPNYVYVSSWGRIYRVTWPAFMSRAWVEELYFVLYQDWYGADRISPTGINLAALQADMQTIKSGGIPDIGPSPNPNPLPDPNTMSLRIAVSTWVDIPDTKPGTIGTARSSVKVVGPVPTASRFEQLPEPDQTHYTNYAANFQQGIYTGSQPVSLSAGSVWGTLVRIGGSIPWGTIWRYLNVVLPVVEADLAAGKGYLQILADVAFAIESAQSSGK